LASVLEDEGVRIHRAYSAQRAQALLEEHSDASVVVLARGFGPPEEVVSELRQQHQDGREVLWVSPTAHILADTLGDGLTAGPAVPTGATGTPAFLEAEQQCTADAASSAQRIRATGTSLQAEDGCFPVESQSEELPG